VDVVREQDDELSGTELDESIAIPVSHNQVTLSVVRVQFEPGDVTIGDPLGP